MRNKKRTSESFRVPGAKVRAGVRRCLGVCWLALPTPCRPRPLSMRHSLSRRAGGVVPPPTGSWRRGAVTSPLAPSARVEKTQSTKRSLSLSLSAENFRVAADCVIMAEEAVASESGTENPLVTVTFQRDANRKKKYLEAEPKALGITQILLSVHLISCVSIPPPNHRNRENIIPFIVASVLVLIAGSVAIAAKNLHLPTLRANLGMQIFSTAACFFNVIWLVIDIESYYPRCWYYDRSENSTAALTCHAIERTRHHLFAQNMLAQVALFAISVTLAAYACKVVNCCGPAPKMPVIMMETSPPAQP